MKPYGVKRFLSYEYPDVADCLEIGTPSRFHKIKSKTRRSSRRLHKKRERLSIKNEIIRGATALEN